MDRQTYIAKKIEDMLNVYPTLKFKIVDHVANIDDFYDKMLRDFQTESPYFWGILTDYNGEYVPIKNADTINENVNCYLHVPFVFIDEAMAYLKGAFASSIVACEFIDDQNRSNLMTMNVPTIFDIQTKDGIDYGIIALNLAFKSSSRFTFGNEVRIYIDNVEVKPFDNRQLDSIKSNVATHYRGEQSAKSHTQENGLKIPLSIYYEDNAPINKLLSEVLDGLQNIKYDLKIIFPNGKIKEWNVILEDGSVAYPLGNFIRLICTFAIANEAIL